MLKRLHLFLLLMFVSIVSTQAQHSIANLGLDAILYLLGMRDRELAELES